MFDEFPCFAAQKEKEQPPMLRLRLARAGAKKRPFYRLVVADRREARDGRFIERLGTFEPVLARDNPARAKLNVERIKYWLGKGAQPSERVARVLGEASVAAMPPRRNNPKKALPRAKAQERLKAKEEKEKAAAGATAPEPVAEAVAPDPAAAEGEASA